MPQLFSEQLRDLGVPAETAPLLLRLDSAAFGDGSGATVELITAEAPEVMCDVGGFVTPGNSSGVVYVLPKFDVVKPGVLVGQGSLVTTACNAGFELVASTPASSTTANVSVTPSSAPAAAAAAAAAGGGEPLLSSPGPGVYAACMGDGGFSVSPFCRPCRPGFFSPGATNETLNPKPQTLNPKP